LGGLRRRKRKAGQPSCFLGATALATQGRGPAAQPPSMLPPLRTCPSALQRSGVGTRSFISLRLHSRSRDSDSDVASSSASGAGSIVNSSRGTGALPPGELSPPGGVGRAAEPRRPQPRLTPTVGGLLIPRASCRTIGARASALKGKGRAPGGFPAAYTHCGPPMRVHR
jgi:hypothetical protein